MHQIVLGDSPKAPHRNSDDLNFFECFFYTIYFQLELVNRLELRHKTLPWIYLRVMNAGFEPTNAGMKVQCVKPLHQFTIEAC